MVRYWWDKAHESLQAARRELAADASAFAINASAGCEGGLAQRPNDLSCPPLFPTDKGHRRLLTTTSPAALAPAHVLLLTYGVQISLLAGGSGAGLESRRTPTPPRQYFWH